jgi:hypothetical protein
MEEEEVVLITRDSILFLLTIYRCIMVKTSLIGTSQKSNSTHVTLLIIFSKGPRGCLTGTHQLSWEIIKKTTLGNFNNRAIVAHLALQGNSKSNECDAQI